MSWHTSAILIGVDHANDIEALLEELGFPGARYVETVSFDDAIAVGDLDGSLSLAVATVDGWTSIWGPFLAGDAAALARISREGPVLTVLLEGGSGTYAFEWFRDGSKLREWTEQAGHAGGEGETLAAEREVFRDFQDGEQRMLALMERLTIPFARLSSARYDVYQLPFD